MFRVKDIKDRKSLLNVAMLCVFLICSVSLWAQTDKKYIRKGNRDYDKDKYAESEILYRKAIDKNKQVLFFINPANKLTRANVTIRASLDQGKTWPNSQVVFPGPSAYRPPSP